MPNILLADDDPMMIDLYNMKFTKAGFTVLIAKTAGEVLPIVHGTVLDAILLDRRLDEADGIDLAKQIRQEPTTGTVPILILSNMDPSKEDLQTIASLGNAEYLIKEKIDLNNLVAKVQSLISKPR